MKKHYRNETDCLNCGAVLQGHYCHICGQENLQIKESFGHMMNHAISDYFHFDHQFFHTLKPLLYKPGLLTNEYMAGRRVQYLHPIKMYIFISIVYFLLLFQSNHEIVKVTNSKDAKTITNIDSARKAIEKDTSMDAETKKMVLGQLSTAKKVSKYVPVNVTTTEGKQSQGRWFRAYTNDTSYAQYIAKQNKLPDDEKDGFVTRQWNKKVFDYKERYGAQAQEIIKEDFKHNIPKMMFILLPLFALILKVTFWRNKKFYVEHLIYAFHYHCYLFLVLAIAMLFHLFIPDSWGILGWIDAFVTFYIMWYTYKSLRIVYHRTRFRTITKIIGMSIMYLLSFTLSICLLLFMIAIV